MQDYLIQMVSLGKKAALNAYVPLCKFAVGACIRTNEGQLFNGCNWENMATPLSQCAETSALSAMLTAGYRKIDEIVLISPKFVCMPCGACRQRLFQFCHRETNFYSYNMDGLLLKSLKFNSLLPAAFTWSSS
ncbi:MAG: cytidine deaminase [Gammaproteobacteria bacterium]|nr:MAG: cytidine deaminase [Gammaproteobacteria bacterium]